MKILFFLIGLSICTLAQTTSIPTAIPKDAYNARGSVLLYFDSSDSTYYYVRIDSTLNAIRTLLDAVKSGSELQVDVVSTALPTGAATEATLGAASTTLSNILTKVSPPTTAPVCTTWSVTTSAVQLPSVSIRRAIIYNLTTTNTYAAGSSVTTSNSAPIGYYQFKVIETDNLSDIWVIGAAATTIIIEYY
ncbi:MAG: hypothetical protein NUV80_00215 [Candidatus Berkelbacteria bacterium]|nr:hypothetical protein [Candidatus Berkelbacteria bacterium]